MEDTRKRLESDDAVDVAGTRPRTPVVPEDDDDEDKEFLIEEDTVVEVMKLLEEEMMSSCSENINKPSSSSSSSSSSSCSCCCCCASSSFVTINGNEESCGPSFSDSASTVMASVDMSGLIGISYLMERTDEFALPRKKEEKIMECSWPEVDLEDVFGSDEINGCDGSGDHQSDDEWMERVLSVGPMEFEFEM